MTIPGLPTQPFDGQEFIDFKSIKWTYDASIRCWRMNGPVNSVPLATTSQNGLLSPQFKILLDSIPERGGSFGIITRPFLSVVPLHRDPIYKGKVYTAIQDAAGSRISVISTADGPFTSGEHAAKMILFTSGILKGQHFIVFTNSSNILYVMGKDAAAAKKNDNFEILEPTAINESGVIQGDIEFVSETITITCVNGNGQAFAPSNGCNINTIFVDDPTNPPGLDFKVNTEFLDEFCVNLPGCAGPRGDKGDVGPQGTHGTGDGPVGAKGASGLQAPYVGKFTGVKINDVDDVYDSAVVALELDANNGKLYVIKAKIKTPSDDKAAEQVIASSINRGVEFTDSDFTYRIMMPNDDQIGSEDVDIIHYPTGFTPNKETETNVIQLSTLIDSVIKFYENKLESVSDEYDQQIKPFIESKDKEAREILNKLADEVSRCEWDLPVDFCLGIVPANCETETIEAKPSPFPLASALLGPEYDQAVGVPLGEYPISPRPSRPGGGGGSSPGSSSGGGSSGEWPPLSPGENIYTGHPDNRIEVRDGIAIPGDRNERRRTEVTPTEYVDVTDANGDTLLPPAAYVIEYVSGASRTDQTTWTSEVVAEYDDLNGNRGSVNTKDSEQALLADYDKDTFSDYQRSASPLETAAVVLLDSPGHIRLSQELPGNTSDGSTTVRVVAVYRDLTSAPGAVVNVAVRSSDGSIIDSFGGSGDGGNDPSDPCPDCDCGDVDVDCGQQDCPPCPVDVDVYTVSPSSATSGSTITLTGTGFGSLPPAITINGVAQTVTANSETSVQFTLNAPDGERTISLTRDDGEGSATAPNALTVGP